MRSKFHRRDFLKAAGLGTLALVHRYLGHWEILAQGAKAQEGKAKDFVEIKINSNYRTGRWSFDPAGIYLTPGQKVRWICGTIGSSATAFHPSNSNHELRIPEKAKPFDSGYLRDREAPGSTFDWVFEVEGTYDYFSRNHERLGAVGRIVVGAPGGPGEKPLGYGGSEGRSPIFADVRQMFTWLSSEKIVREKVVRYPAEMMDRTFPMQESHF